MENDIFVKYDSLCYATLVNIKTKTTDASRIVLRNFNWKDDEHKFVVAIINACYGVLGERTVAIETGPMTRGTIARKFSSLGKIRKPRPDEDKFVDVAEMLEFMRPSAVSLCGEDFSFANIYKAYYERETGYDI